MVKMGYSINWNAEFSHNKIFIFVTENVADFLINNMWKTGFVFVRPLINDLVSTAFTDIFNESFRYFPIEEYLKSNKL